MPKAPAEGSDSAPSPDSSLRTIPSVERILAAASFAPLAAKFGRESLKRSVTDYLDAIRLSRTAYEEREALVSVTKTLQAGWSSTLRRTINATGIIIHTNLGRSPIDAAVWSEAAQLVSGYVNLEFDLESGERGARDEHLSSLCRSLFGAEAAILTNNNAAGTMLLLAAVAARKEVIVSRGELVEIGGAFRVPDVIEQGGAKLREVGTTNRTRAADYAEAVSRRTGALLRVHRSNFDIVGFTEMPSIDELVTVAREKRVPLLYDEGAGCVVDLAGYGFPSKATIASLFASGVDAITCSTDKLLGSVQGGLILGRRDLVDRARRHPLMRAVRAGKETYAILAATLQAFASGQHETRVPIYRMLSATLDELRARGERIASGSTAQIVESRAALGGGTTPAQTIPSLAIHVPGDAAKLHQRFLRHDVPIVGRVQEERFLLDLRTMLEADEEIVRMAISGT